MDASVNCVKTLVEKVHSLGVNLTLDNDTLKYQSQTSPLDSSIKSLLKDNRDEIIRFLKQEGAMPFSMTPLQQAYWIGESTFYDAPVKAHIYQEFEASELDVEQLERAINQLIALHPMLRVKVTGDGKQRIQTYLPWYKISCFNLKGKTPFELQKHRKDLAGQCENNLPDLEFGPPFWLAVTTLDDGFIIHLGLRIFVFDGPSAQIFFHDLSLLYSGKTLRCDTAFDYQSYLSQIESSKQRKEYQLAKEYWESKSGNFPAAPSIPVKHTLGQPEGRFKRLTGNTDALGWQRIKHAAKRYGITVNSLLLAVYAEALRPWAGTDRFSINIMFSDSRFVDATNREFIGNCSNTLLTDLHLKNQSLLKNTKEIQEQLFLDMAHSTFHGVDFVRQLNHHLSDKPAALAPVVFSSFLGLERAEDAVSQPLPGWKLINGTMKTPQVTLDHQVFTTEGKLFFNWDYDDSCHDASILKKVFNHYKEILSYIADHEDWADYACPSVPEAELANRNLRNDTRQNIPAKLLHSGVIKHAIDNPDKTAMIHNDLALTYKELDALARKLQRKLDSAGIKPGDFVGVYMDKSWLQIASVLGILYAGAIYVPVSKKSPVDRIERIATAAQLGVLLSDTDIPDHLSVRKLLLSGESLLTESKEYSPKPVTSTNPSSLAYVIFTSGSTGTPKGVMISHEAANNTIQDVLTRFSIDHKDRVLALSDLSFDLSVFDIFGTFFCGGTLIIPNEQSIPDPKEWRTLIDRHQITVWNSVPALLSMYLQFEQDGLESLRIVMLSGDWIPLNLPEQLSNVSPARLISLGGATEASIWSNYYEVDKVPPEWPSIPYGFPLSNQQFHILNRRFQHVPNWVEGDLYISGDGLAKGYMGSKELSEASFFYHSDLNKNVYKTGDRGRYWEDGTIEFLGREDFQVKIRGFRIELGEIEASLKGISGIKSSKALAFSSEEDGATKLALFYVSGKDSEYTDSRILSHIKQKLPSYMVPNYVIPIPGIPLTANGKVDRKSLIRLVTEQEVKADSQTCEPDEYSDLQKRLIILWQEFIPTTNIGLNSDFFALGGESISAVGLANKIANEFCIACPPSIVVEHSKLFNQAKYIEHELVDAGKGSSELRCVIPQSKTDVRKPTLVLIHAVGGTVFCYRSFAESWGEEFNIVTVQAPEINRLRNIANLSELSELYAEQIAGYLVGNQLHENNWFLGGWSLGGILASEIANRLTHRDDLVLPERVLMLDSYCRDENTDLEDITELQLAILFFEDFLQRAGFSESVQETGFKESENLFEALYRHCSSQGYLKKQEENGLTESVARNQYELFSSLYRQLLNHTPAKTRLPTCYVKATECPAEHFPGLVPFATKENRLHYIEVEANHQSIIDKSKSWLIHESFLKPLAGELEGT